MKVIKGLVLLCLMMLAGCQSEEETSQFLLACKYDAPATIAAMLDNGIDVDGQDKTGLSGLMVAAAENRRDVVELLLKRRAKPNLQTRQGVTALMLAAARGSDTAIIGDLLQAGASVNQTSIDKSTALMSAISDGGDVRNDYQHILAMKKPDAPVEEESTLDKIVGATAAKSLATGNRALMTEDMALQLAPGAFKKNVDEIVALLLKHGADVKAVNASGESAFFLAVDHARSAETITTLANAGADTSLADKSGTTPLMLAAAGDDPNLVLALSASGGEVDKPNRVGLTALQVATAIVRKLNPQCGFVLLDKLEQMDLDTLNEFGHWLEAEGLQAIATRVSKGEECQIIIEDGYAVKNDTLTHDPEGINEKAQAAPAWAPGKF